MRSEDPGANLLAAIELAIEQSRILAEARDIPGNSIVLEHRVLVGLLNIRRTVISHNATRLAAKGETQHAAPAPAPVAQLVQSVAPKPGSPGAPETNLDPNFQKALEELAGRKP